jgi:hypothetical protein
MIAALDSRAPIVDKDGRMAPRTYNWMLDVTNLAIITGNGSPEGVVVAQQSRLYMNTAGTAGSILWIKRDADIGGDRSQGWILV